jgi:hypothetical protein
MHCVTFFKIYCNPAQRQMGLAASLKDAKKNQGNALVAGGETGTFEALI